MALEEAGPGIEALEQAAGLGEVGTEAGIGPEGTLELGFETPGLGPGTDPAPGAVLDTPGEAGLGRGLDGPVVGRGLGIGTGLEAGSGLEEAGPGTGIDIGPGRVPGAGRRPGLGRALGGTDLLDGL